MGTEPKVSNRIPIGLLVVYVLLLSTIVFSAVYFYKYQKETIQRDEENLFIFVSNLKQHQIEVWREERLSDARSIFFNSYLKSGIKNYLDNSKNFSVKNGLQAWIESLLTDKNYQSAFIINNKYQLLLQTDSSQNLDEFTKDLCINSLTSGELSLSDLHKNQNSGEIYLELIIPIIIDNEKCGVLVLKINPYTIFFPLIQSWPVPSKTAESLLVENENDSVVYLNELRHQKNSSLKLKYPISAPQLPAARVIRGEKGLFFGIDYRGANVVAYGQKISSTPWYIVTKIETSELFEKIEERSTVILVTSVLFLISITLAFWYLLKKQIKYFIQLVFRTEEDKKILEKRYEYIIQRANDIILFMDESGNIVFSNERAEQIYGYTRQDLLKLNIRNLKPDELRNKDQVHMKLANSSEGTVYETVHKRINGALVPVEVSSRGIEIEGKKYFQSIIRDISDRKESERRILQLNRIYSLLSDINQMIVRVTEEEKLFEETCNIAVSRGGFKMASIGMVNHATNYFEIVAKAGCYEDYLNNFPLNMKDPRLSPGPSITCLTTAAHSICNDIENDIRMLPWRESAMRNDFRSSAAFPLITNNKAIGTINLYSDLKNFFTSEEIKLLDEMSSDISYAITFLRNERKRKKSEEALRKSWERYKELFENNPNPMWIYDDDTLKFIDINKTALNLYGFTKDEFLSMNIMDIRPEEDVSQVLEFLKSSREDLRISHNVRHKKKDGTIILAEIKSNILFLGGEQRFRIVSINDVTEQKRIMDEIMIAKQNAEEAMKARNVFLGTMSHELRTPLIGILGYSDILANELANSEYAEMAKGIKRGGNRLLNTLNLILDYTRIESDRLEVTLKQLNIIEPLKFAFNEFEGTTSEKKIGYSLNLLSENLTAEIDDHLFIIIMENLINNAVKFTRQGSIVVTAGINQNNKIFISVSDSGIGIDEQHLELIFEEFKQISEGINREYQGTGLGLTITKKYIEMLNGDIKVESKAGEGTKFTILFNQA